MYPTENSYGLSTCLFATAVSQSCQNCKCNNVQYQGHIKFLIKGCQNTQWAEAQTSVWECYLFVPVTYPNI